MLNTRQSLGRIIIIIIIAAAAICSIRLWLRSAGGIDRQFRDNAVVQKQAEEDEIGGATGALFSGAKIRTFDGPLKLQSKMGLLQSSSAVRSMSFPIMGASCDKWGVVTTIFKPAEAVKVVSQLEGWCLVVVGDTKTPANYTESLMGMLPGGSDGGMPMPFVFLSADEQMKMTSPFVRRMPFKSFSRKNVGYLYAVRHGAEVIYDFDDDNVLKLPAQYEPGATIPARVSPLTEFVNETDRLKTRVLTGCKPTKYPLPFNPFPLMHPSINGTWPRGFDLSFIKNKESTGHGCYDLLTTVAKDGVGVVQGTHDHDPDVDAVYRLTRKVHFTYASGPSAKSLQVPHGMFAPYNAQATLHYKKAFWGLFLPFTVKGRVSDIWRSYFTARIFQDVGLSIIYTPPLVVQYRNAHKYLGDMSAEQDLYFKTEQLLAFLDSWTPGPAADISSLHLPARLERLWVALYERDFIGHEDVLAFQDWLLTLVSVGYEFPAQYNYEPPEIMVMGQFNMPMDLKMVDRWMGQWAQVYPADNIVAFLPTGTNLEQNKDSRKRMYIEPGSGMGYVSPYLNLARFAMELVNKEGNTATGILYVHDDMVVTSSFLRRIETQPRSWYIAPYAGNSTGWALYDTGPINGPTDWPNFELCRAPYENVSKDARMSRFWLRDGKTNKIPLTNGQSDMMYLSLHDKKAVKMFAELAEIFGDHKVFLECALPTIFELVGQRPGVSMEIANLCTSWDNNRSFPSSWPCSQNSDGVELFHPVKISSGNFEPWFESMTLNGLASVPP